MPCPSAEDPICSTQVREARQQGTEERRRLPFSKVCSRHRVGVREQMPTSSADCSPRSLVQPGTCTTARLAQETQLPQLQEASWLEEESIPCSAFIYSAIKEIFIVSLLHTGHCSACCRQSPCFQEAYTSVLGDRQMHTHNMGVYVSLCVCTCLYARMCVREVIVRAVVKNKAK